jgi:hypothetical protein
MTSASRLDRQAASQVYCSKGFPVLASKSFPGRRLEAHLAGIMPTVLIGFLEKKCVTGQVGGSSTTRRSESRGDFERMFSFQMGNPGKLLHPLQSASPVKSLSSI